MGAGFQQLRADCRTYALPFQQDIDLVGSYLVRELIIVPVNDMMEVI